MQKYNLFNNNKFILSKFQILYKFKIINTLNKHIQKIIIPLISLFRFNSFQHR